jgi:imidazolonepropionase-like amidohydrolase
MEIRDAIKRNMFLGPRMYGAAHYISVTGGGGDINSYSYEQPLISDGLIADGPDNMRKAVRTEIKYGSDWIKLMITGAFMSAGNNPKNVHFSHAELQAAMEEALNRNIPVMAHAHSTEGIKMAVKSGARTIEHGSFIDENTMDLMIQYGTWLIPTLTIRIFYADEAFKSESMQKATDFNRLTKESIYTNFKLAFKKGVKFGLGTDFVGWPPEYSAKEFEEYIKIGFTPMQAIICATKNNATILQKDNEIGTVEVGKFADIIAVKHDPLKDITELQRVRFVMVGGKIVKNE